MNFLKKFFLEWKIKQALKKRQNLAHRRTPNYEEAKSIGILLYVTHSADLVEVKKLLKTFAKDGKKVVCLVYFPKPENLPTLDFQHYVLTDKEIDTWGNVKLEIVQNFIEQPFDYLYCISQEEVLAFQYILASSKARCRIGKYSAQNAVFFEMMIDLKTEQNIKTFTEQALHYTQSIIYN